MAEELVEEKQESNEKKEKLLKILIPSLSALLIVSCIVIFILCMVPFSKTFEGEGYKITLTSKYTEVPEQNYVTTYHGSEIKVFVSRETFEEIALYPERVDPANETRRDFIAADFLTNGVSSEIFEDGDLMYYEYQRVYNGKTLFYRAYVFKTTTAFWRIQFGCENNNKENLISQIEEFAKSIEIENVVQNA